MLKKTFQNKMNTIRNEAVRKAGAVDTVKKIATAPLNLVKKQWNKNQAFRNKNSTRAKFEQNSK